MNMGKWVPIIRCGHVEFAVIPTWSPTTVRLGDDMKRRCPGGVGRADDAQLCHLLELLFCDRQLITKETARASVDGRTRGRNGVVDAVTGNVDDEMMVPEKV